jgi:hypothetical protein
MKGMNFGNHFLGRTAASGSGWVAVVVAVVWGAAYAYGVNDTFD